MLVCKEPTSTTDISSRKRDKNEHLKVKLNPVHIGTPVPVEKGSSVKPEHKEDASVTGTVLKKKVRFSET